MQSALLLLCDEFGSQPVGSASSMCELEGVGRRNHLVGLPTSVHSCKIQAKQVTSIDLECKATAHRF